MVRRPLTAVALACASVLVLSSAGLAAGQASIRVSQGDPFADCRLGGNADPKTRNYQSAEVEPWIADNPANTNNLIGTWQQDRWNDGGAKGQVASWSFDGGKTWGQTPQPFTTCAQPFYKTPVLKYERASDPWVSIGADGTAYAVSLLFDGDSIRNGLGAAVSHDGGRTWVQQQDIDPLVADPNTFSPSDDKESVTADPLRAGWAYVVWEQFHDVCPAPATHAPVRSGRDSKKRSARAAATTQIVCGTTAPTYFSRTTNGGKTWSKPKQIVPTGFNEQTIGNQIVVNRQTGTLYNFYDYITADLQNNIEMVFSTNHGATWSKRMHVQRMATNEETSACGCGVTDPRPPNNALRTGDIIPSPAIDPDTGQLYVIWQDGRANPDLTAANDMLYASTSTGGGLAGTWSAPVRVNPPDDLAAFTAAISVNSQGQVGVIYYDFSPPLTTNLDVLLTDTWFTMTNGPGLNFGARKLIGGPFNMAAAPVAKGFFVGDYTGLAAKIANADLQQTGDANSKDGEGTGFVPIFVMTNCRDTSCTAVGTPDGSPAGPDSTDAFTQGP